jgi:hypothetical protein
MRETHETLSLPTFLTKMQGCRQPKSASANNGNFRRGSGHLIR